MGTTRLSAEGAVGRGLSPEIWQTYGFIGGNNDDPSLNGFFFDDFAEGTNFVTEASAKYACLNDSGAGTFVADSAVDLSEGEFGVLKGTFDGTEHDQFSIQMGGNVGNIVKIDDADNEAGVVCFECRIKVNTITTGDLRMFFGLAEFGLHADNAFYSDTAATFVDKDYIGFMVKEADGASLIRQFHKAGADSTPWNGDAQDTGDDLVADTWIKLGLVYDPNEASDRLIKFFIDGSECTNAGDTRCDATDLADDDNFPAGEEMSPLILAKAADNTANLDALYIDWWAVGQGFTG